MSSESTDFFISYTVSDERWATWIAWHLEQAGHSVTIQAWDFRPGSNFVVEMNRASLTSHRTVLVLSAAALSSDFVQSEWAAAFSGDPAGALKKLVPVRVEDCDVAGLLGNVVYVDLVGVPADEAVGILLAGIDPGRSKPAVAPEFPASNPTVQTHTKSASASWEAAPDGLTFTRLRDLDSSVDRGSVAIAEVHLVPTSRVQIPLTHLTRNTDGIATAGRDAGLFAIADGLDVMSTHELIALRTKERRVDDNGLILTRYGQRGAWLSLPRDTLGSVLDPEILGARLSSTLALLAEIDVSTAPRYALTALVGPTMMLTIGDSATIGQRTSASLGMGRKTVVELPIEDSVNVEDIKRNSSEIAAELVARLIARF